MDGIGGIVIGNVFRINPNRLPIGYQEKDIAFMTHAESQTITSGQDWTTEISGQLLLLDLESDPIEYEGIVISPGDFAIKELGIDENPTTPNADKLRQVIEALEYTEKGHTEGTRGFNKGHLTQNGDITEEMFLLMANVLVRIKEQLGDKVKIEVTGGNDNYHKNSETSRHVFGRAVDFVIKEPIPKKYKYPTSKNYDKNLYRIDTILRSFVGAKSAGGNIRYLNEYVFPSPHASAPHFHLSLNTLQGQGSEGGPDGFGSQQNFTGKPGEEGAMDNLTLSEKLISGREESYFVESDSITKYDHNEKNDNGDSVNCYIEEQDTGRFYKIGCEEEYDISNAGDEIFWTTNTTKGMKDEQGNTDQVKEIDLMSEGVIEAAITRVWKIHREFKFQEVQ